MDSKQVIVMRKDLNMRKGKMCAQASHASLACITKNCFMGAVPVREESDFCFPVYASLSQIMEQSTWNELYHWCNNSFRKITCAVNSEAELEEIYQKALDAGLIVHMVIDNGATEFNGVKTKTCLAIGPHWDERFKGITDHLPLL